MSQTRTNYFPAAADATLVGAGPYVRVKITGAKLTNGLYPVGLAAAADDAIGFLNGTRANKINDPVTVVLGCANETRIGVSDGAIAVGAEVFAGAGGKVSAAGTISVGQALEAAAAAGDYIEIGPKS